MRKLVSSIVLIGLLSTAPVSTFAASDSQQLQTPQSAEYIISPATVSKTVLTNVTYYNVTADFVAPSTFFMLILSGQVL